MTDDFPRITIEQMREVMSKRDSFATVALNAKFRYDIGRGQGFCSCCGNVRVCADWLPPYQVCSDCFNQATGRQVMNEYEAEAVRFYVQNPAKALEDFKKRKIEE